MRFQLTIHASTGGVTVRVDGPEEVRELVSMVAAGAQVRQSVSVRLEDLTKRAAVSLEARSSRDICEAVDHALFALAALQPRPHAENQSRDVSVRVHMAVDGSVSLERVEAFVSDIMAAALDDCAKAEGVTVPLYQYNGEIVHNARWED